MTDEHHYIVAMLHYGERKHSCVQERIRQVIGLSLSFLLFQNGKSHCNVIWSLLSAGMSFRTNAAFSRDVVGMSTIKCST